MSGEASPDKMDISETSDTSSHEISNSSQVLRFECEQEKPDLDNATSSIKSVSLNATNSHPLMYTCTSPISPDFPDLIPEKPKSKHGNYNTIKQETGGEELEGCLHFNLPPLNEYNELPDFPESPSALKKSLMYDLPLEVTTNTELSDTENDKSVYEAHLSSNLQNVCLTMNEKEGNLNFLAHKKRSNKLRRVKVMETEASEESDISSLDSISESLKSEHVFTGGQLEIGVEEQDNSSEPIEPLSAADERRHARHWQRMVLPGGEQRTIDMRVIEPYKRVLSHGGYLRAGGHTAIVIFSACYLPDRSRVDYVYVMDNLFLYILWTLERLVTDDYVLVYLHGGATKLPAFSWLKKCYQMVGRKLRKNLSHLYLVHPTLWIKTMLFMAKPFISSKFYRKISYVSSLKELMVRVPLEAAAIPDKVKAYDSLHCVT
ncbi:protein prune homolog 2 [Tribolium castaneum]|uniref:Protein prune homolog 2-like Protein n=1 Tax=Tribolium castaneum TaxID=7070 RepID=D6WRW2_TRICA|nr:PREDICTED: protein prune homolog 2 [Tribolium castaneum]EFA06589.2 Protein prune homolog 2-like Protein [Tribolium castaneum]|eukprot:XP_974968.2 PREDICTED: protein prune homolog 2 [Tribolium castaneum]